MATNVNQSGSTGFSLPPVDVAWMKRDLLLFANSIGVLADELHFLYELHPSFSAFPTYPIVLSFKHTDQDVIDFYARTLAASAGKFAFPEGIPRPDPKRTVDGQRHLTVIKPIPFEGKKGEWELRARCLGVYDKGKAGMVTEMETLLVEKKTGEVYTKIVSSSFSVGQGGWGGPKGPPTVNYPPPQGKLPDATYTQATSAQSALLYRLNGDYNPLHADPSVGASMRFPGAIMHGLYTWNSSCHAILRSFGGSQPERLLEFQARFASIVIPGDTLVIDMWRTGKKVGEGEEIIFVTKVKETGKVVLSNGRAVVKLVGSDSKL
ncbi:putative peroxisomal dehydratase [Peziza echinospora]|nr:putative peroxisomal dehydratase [Peziza echinospora]